ncbi:hypothetical protein EG329_010574 [Mollisiaceae sp. DMI_Dod_QoI]|nr:hypothetical protein EG329_010574 [Helotiales sp. DMI_Dod_QoI]
MTLNIDRDTTEDDGQKREVSIRKWYINTKRLGGDPILIRGDNPQAKDLPDVSLTSDYTV